MHERTLGFPSTLVEKLNFSSCVHPDDRDRVLSGLHSILNQNGKRNLQLEYRLLKQDGHWVSVEAVWSPVETLKGTADSVLVVGRDITKRMEIEERLSFLAYHDPLTGLANRDLLQQQLHTALLHAKEMNHSLAVLYMDLDRFKSINDSLGHSVGDLLLQQVSHRLLTATPPHSTVGRMGGDEFAILIPVVQDKHEASIIAARIVMSFSDHFTIESYELHMTPSIGIAVYPEGGQNGMELLRHSDAAMYRVKSQGKNNFQFYLQSMEQQTYRRIQLERDLYRAMEAKEFTLVYQPLIRVADHSIYGMEALLRWNHPVLGWISPSEFIPIAEETGMIIPLGNWVIKTVCEQSKAWMESGLPTFKIGINLSVRQILHARFIKTLTEILEGSGVETASIAFEITETMMMENMDRSIKVLQHIHHMGITMSIDDFGTGYSSLNYLRKLPIDTLKIDRSFIDEIKEQTDQAELVKAIISMAHSLNKLVVAEGVETKEQYSFLERENCDVIQGYFFSKPLNADEIMANYITIGSLL